MMRKAAIFIYVGVVALLLLRTGQSSVHLLAELLQREAPDSAPRLVIGWVIATFAPLLLSICVLFFRRKLGAGRWLHLLFVPCALACYRVGGIMLDPSPTGEDIIAEYALVPATALLLLTLLFHLAGFVRALLPEKPPSLRGN